MKSKARSAYRSVLGPWLAVAVVGSACAGSINSNSGQGGEAGSGTGGGAGIIDVMPPPDIAKSCPTITLGPSNIRRLSQQEYHNTLRDLFSGVDVGKQDLSADQNTLGFENRAKDLFATQNNVGDFGRIATDVATKAITNLKSLVPCATQDAACAGMFIDKFGARVYRRPLAADEKQRYQAFFDLQNPLVGFNTTIQLIVEAMLQSPNFLYRPELGGKDLGGGKVQVTGYEMASRLSYFVWGSMPDATLFDAAAKGLDTSDGVVAQATRMLSDEKARGQIVDFHRQWLQYDHVTEILAKEGAKDPKLYPNYGAALVASMREESDRFSGRVLFDGSRTLKELLTSRDTFVDASLAALYGVQAPASGWGAATLTDGERGGILTQAAFLASHAHKIAGSPPLRGNFIRTRFLCGDPLTPDPKANTSEPAGAAGPAPQTNRQLFEQRLKDGGAGCVGCHAFFDPMGNTFEHYDAIGKFRAKDNNVDVDSTGALLLEAGNQDVTDAIGLSAAIGDSPEVAQCMTGNWFEFAVGRNQTDDDTCKVTALANDLGKAGGDIRHLQLAIAALPDFQQRLAQ